MEKGILRLAVLFREASGRDISFQPFGTAAPASSREAPPARPPGDWPDRGLRGRLGRPRGVPAGAGAAPEHYSEEHYSTSIGF